MSTTNLIQIQNLTKSYTNGNIKTDVLKGISFKIDQGEFVSIMGPSGSGKSTLMHILGFLDRPTEGKYLFKGEPAKKLNDNKLAEIRNNEIGFVFQSANLLARTSVYENIRLPIIYNSNKKNQKEKILNAAKNMGLEHRIRNLSNQLSGGEQARVAIARAIVLSPSIIFADEPTGNLDSVNGQKVMKILQDLNNIGHTIILVTHESATARHAKRILFIKDGKLESDEIVKDRVVASEKGELDK